MRAALIALAFILAVGLLVWLATTASTPTNMVAVGRGGGSGEAATGTQAVTLVPKPGERSELRTLPRGRIDDVEQLARSLPPGTLVVAVPAEARLGQPFEVHAILVPDAEGLRDFAISGHAQRRRAAEALTLSNLYRATLDPGGLALDSTAQRDVRWRNEGPVSWTWTVTGRTTGPATLQFAFEVQTELDGQTEMRRVRVMGREVTVTDPLWPKVAAALAGRWWMAGLALAFVVAGIALAILLPRKRGAAARG